MKVGIGQIRVVGGRPEENLDRAIKAVFEIAAQDAEVAVLPECLDVGWTHPTARDAAEPIPGRRSDRLAKAARDTGIAVVAGLTEAGDGTVYNTALFIDPSGAIAARHRKINILDIAADLYTPGRSLKIFETSLGSTALAVCADCLPEALPLPIALGHLGADILLSPCAWAVPPGYDNRVTPYGSEWEESYVAVAEQYGTAVVAVSNVGTIDGGPWDGYDCIGNSRVVIPGGGVLYRGPFGRDAETIVVVDIPAGT